jgi:hypothetical protein
VQRDDGGRQGSPEDEVVTEGSVHPTVSLWGSSHPSPRRGTLARVKLPDRPLTAWVAAYAGLGALAAPAIWYVTGIADGVATEPSECLCATAPGAAFGAISGVGLWAAVRSAKGRRSRVG